MRNIAALVGLAATVAVTSLASTAGATYNTVWIHGRTTYGTPSGSSYWLNKSGGSSIATGTNISYANYDGTAHISASNPSVVATLNSQCKGTNPCVIACHSAGCAQIGYAIAAYYNSSTGKIPWNIYSVVTGGSAENGSELAGNTAYFFTGENIDSDLAINTMRGMYNHDLEGNLISNYVYDELGGDWATLTTCLFEGGCTGGGGQNDSAVSFQSSGRFRSSGTQGSDGASSSNDGSGNSTWWNYSIAWTVDTSDTYGHCIIGSYPCQQGASNGVMSLVAGGISYNSW